MKQILLMMAAVALVGCASTPMTPTNPNWVSDPSDQNNVIIEELIRKYLMESISDLPKQERKEWWSENVRKPRSLQGMPVGEITKEDLEKVSEFAAGGFRVAESNKLTDLMGLEKLTQLKELGLVYNQLTGVKELPHLRQLEWLNLGYNKLTDVKGLEKLTQLKELLLYENQLTKIPKGLAKGLEKLTQLETLDLHSNKLTSVKGLEKCTQLTELLSLDGNQLTEVKGLEKLTKLKKLYFNHNQLTSVKGLEKLTKLTGLGLGWNQLTSVKGLEKLTQLKTLWLPSNQLTDLTGLEKLTQLKELNLFDNPALTKAQIDQLQKALPNCRIRSNPKK